MFELIDSDKLESDDDAINVAPYEAFDATFNPLLSVSFFGAANNVGVSLDAANELVLYPDPPKLSDIA